MQLSHYRRYQGVQESWFLINAQGETLPEATDKVSESIRKVAGLYKKVQQQLLPVTLNTLEQNFR